MGMKTDKQRRADCELKQRREREREGEKERQSAHMYVCVHMFALTTVQCHVNC